MAATFIVPELAIDETEAKQLAIGIAAVNEFYGKTIDPKVTAWIGLLAVCGKVYGPRVGAYMVRKEIEKNSRPAIAPLAGKPQVTQSPQAPQQPAQRQNVAPEIVRIFNDPANVSLPTE